MKIPSVLIATPCYQSICYTPYLNSLMVTVRTLDKLGVKNDLLIINGDSYIDRARNSIVAKFLNEEIYKDYEKLFFIDSDMRWDAEGFIRTLCSPYDFTGAAYPMKNRWDDFSVRHFNKPDKTPLVTDDGFIESALVPGGFLCLSRYCLVKMCSKYSENYYIDTNSAYKSETINLFENRIVSHSRQGEDSSLCHKWNEMGEKIYCQPNVSFGHIGTKEWSGNYHETLLKQPTPIDKITMEGGRYGS